MNEEIFTNYYKRYYNRLLNTSLRIVLHRELAEEVVNDTMMKMLKKDITSLTIEQVEAWLYRSCVNCSIDYLRINKREVLKFDEYETNEIENIRIEESWKGYIDSSGEITDKVEQIKQAITKLKNGYRVVLLLHLFEGYDYDEIADILNIKNASVRSQYLRGKLKLLKILQNG